MPIAIICTTTFRKTVRRWFGIRSISLSTAGVAATLEPIPTGVTYRWQFTRLTADTPWLYFFLDYALGHPVDRQMSAWQESFLPEKLAEHLRTVRISDRRGGLRPLVRAEKQLTPSTFKVLDAPPHRFLVYFAVGLGFGAILCGSTFLGRNVIARWAFTLLGMGWSLIAGLLGGFLTYIWFSDHVAAMWNENWFQLNPLSLLLVVLIPGRRRWPRAAKFIGYAVLGLSAIDCIAKCTPWAFQVNGNLIALALPVHAVIAAGVARRCHSGVMPAGRAKAAFA